MLESGVIRGVLQEGKDGAGASEASVELEVLKVRERDVSLTSDGACMSISLRRYFS